MRTLSKLAIIGVVVFVALQGFGPPFRFDPREPKYRRLHPRCGRSSTGAATAAIRAQRRLAWGPSNCARLLAGAARYPYRARAPGFLHAGFQTRCCSKGDAVRGCEHDLAGSDASAEVHETTSGGENKSAEELATIKAQQSGAVDGYAESDRHSADQ